jgi:RNA polymerase sigma-70 factor (ECF subfamily)
MTGSASDAEDLVQDAWIRYLDSGTPKVDSLRAYLTTIISRLSLDYLKSARVQRERYIGTWLPEPVLTADAAAGPAETAEQRESVSLALLTLLEQLTPEQRVVYVLREGFDLPYDEVALHVGKSPATCRQIFRRAQQHIEQRITSPRNQHHASFQESRSLIERFMTAFAQGDVAGVASVLTEDVIWVADGGPERLSNRRGIRGRDRVSRGLAGLARKARPELGMELSIDFVDLNGAPAVVVCDHGKIERVFAFGFSDGGIAEIQVIINPTKLRHLAATLGTEPAWESPLPRPRSTVAS